MINSATLIGRVGKKYERNLNNGDKMVSISVATSKNWINKKGEKEEKTTWHNVNFYSKLGEIANKFVDVGSLVYIEGEINHNQITSGERQGQYAYSITANQLKLLPNGAKKTDAPKNGNYKPKNANNYEEEFDDAIPF